MPIAFIAIGALFLVAAVRGTISTNGNTEGLVPLLIGDFVPSNGNTSFLVWIVAIWALGAIGYIPGFRPISNALLVLFVLVFFLSNKGFFSQLNSAIRTSPTTGVN